ncbi:DUF4179 domain-containing protein [Metabacillus idriensis]|uniref:DUF4179 domain-containing protein n=1 Tax=Metabacillus idriensis TaxID=324768 RepID=UPI00174E7162|nr:DUF4179 domain-containing protein [Metabacillus idriensis]
MDKKWFNSQLAEIELPEDEIFSAIDCGIKAGREQKRFNRRFTGKSAAILSAAAASIVLASGFVFAPVTNVLASVPLLGSIYENFSFSIGKELSASNLVTELNEKATSNGVSVTLTSVFFDGNVVGVTFKAEGDSLPEKWVEGPNDPVSGYSHYLFDGSESKQWSGGQSGIVKTEKGYIGSMELHNPSKDLPSDFTLPLTFYYMAGQKGEWKFNVPVKQIPPETIAVMGKSEVGNYTLNMKSITMGKATTMLEYETMFPLSGEDDQITIHVTDDQGREFSPSHRDILQKEEKNGMLLEQVRYLFTNKMSSESKFLMIYPEVERDEPRILESIKSAPFKVESKRFEYKIDINSIEKKGTELILDYRVENVKASDYKEDILVNFADSISLEKGKSIIYGNQGKLIDKEKMQFQSRFSVPDDFNSSEFSISVPFGIFSINAEPMKMEPLRVMINND